jgi:hypothetical protein
MKNKIKNKINKGKTPNQGNMRKEKKEKERKDPSPNKKTTPKSSNAKTHNGGEPKLRRGEIKVLVS